MEEQAHRPVPKRRGVGYWIAVVVVHLLSTLLVMLFTTPFAILVKMTEGSREAELLFVVCYYVFCMALAVPIARGYLPATISTKPAIDYFWPFMGLVPGTFLVAWFAMSGDPIQRLVGGLCYAGAPLGILGLAYAIYRRNRERRRLQLPDPLDATPCSGEN